MNTQPAFDATAGAARRALVADAVATNLNRHGVEVMFSQSLPSRVVLACQDIGIRQITYRTENAGGVMADGFARLSGRVGVVCAQNGPAATLLVPPLAEALKASIPVLAIVQEVNRNETDRNAFQEFDHIELFKSCTKWCRRVTSAERVTDYIDMAVIAATSGRPGPVALMFPADLLNEDAAAQPFARSQMLGHWPLDRPEADRAEISRAADLIAAAKLPLVIAGGGIHSSGAARALAALQDTAALPVGTTMMGKGAVDEGHPLSIGLVGNAMGRRSIGHYTKELISEADVVLLVGTRTNQNGTDSWRLLPEAAQIIHIDIDGLEIGRTYESLRLVGDAKLTLEALERALRDRELSRRESGRALLETRIAEARRKHEGAVAGITASDQAPLRPERIMRELERQLSADSIVVADASYASVWVTTYITASKVGMRFLTPRGLAGLGWGLPLAMGAKLAGPRRPVVCIAGDGGFGHVWSELETLVREAIPLVLIVLNNTVLGYQKDAEDVKFGRHSEACQLGAVDHAAVAAACGCAAERVTEAAQLAPAFKRALDAGKPYLLDISTDPQAYPPLTLFDGTLDR